MVRLILADDHKLMRDGVKALLRHSGVEIAGEAASGKELLDILTSTPVDIVLLDISMPEVDGFECVRHIKQHYPNVKVLVLSMLDHECYVNKMMEYGAFGYILKTIGKEELRLAIELVANGIPYICSSLTLELLRKSNIRSNGDSPVKEPSFKGKLHKELSKREVEVLNLISEGFTNADIAEKLFTSKRTIETHRQNLLEKTQTRNTAALIKYAVLNGIIS